MIHALRAHREKQKQCENTIKSNIHNAVHNQPASSAEAEGIGVGVLYTTQHFVHSFVLKVQLYASTVQPKDAKALLTLGKCGFQTQQPPDNSISKNSTQDIGT